MPSTPRVVRSRHLRPCSLIPIVDDYPSRRFVRLPPQLTASPLEYARGDAGREAPGPSRWLASRRGARCERRHHLDIQSGGRRSGGRRRGLDYPSYGHRRTRRRRDLDRRRRASMYPSAARPTSSARIAAVRSVSSLTRPKPSARNWLLCIGSGASTPIWRNKLPTS